jgi:hypothetical protein
MPFTPETAHTGTQFKPGESGNPKGKPKGAKHISTHIQNLMEDEDFEANILDAKTGIKEYKGAPVKAIIQVAITKAINGDAKAMDWLAKYGWTAKTEIDLTSNGETVGTNDAATAVEFAEFLKSKGK